MLDKLTIDHDVDLFFISDYLFEFRDLNFPKVSVFCNFLEGIRSMQKALIRMNDEIVRENCVDYQGVVTM